MAIKIPSKNIYEISNPKIRDNVIDNINVKQTVISQDNEYRVSVYNEKFDSDWVYRNNVPAISQAQKNTNVGNLIQYERSIAYMSIKPIYKTVVLDIDRQIDNKFISKLYDSYQEQGNGQKIADIGVSVFVKKSEGLATASASYSFINGQEGAKLITNPILTYTTQEDAQIVKPELSYTFNGIETNPTAELSESVIEDSTLNASTVSTYSKFYINFNVLVGYEQVFLGNYVSGVTNPPPASGTIELNGNCVKYEPQRLEVTIYGDTIGINLTDGSVTYGSGNKPFSLEGNELLQDSGKVGEILITKHLGNNVLTEYQKGKETAILLCDISDYYDESGEKVIDIKTEKMSFRLHDEVIPYVFGANGQDQPMSRYQDGLPKVFEVVGSNIIYDGAVWQELTLLEKVAKTIDK
jgi:hypothetical protein